MIADFQDKATGHAGAQFQRVRNSLLENGANQRTEGADTGTKAASPVNPRWPLLDATPN
jgi:hypothetical protein